MIKLFLQQHRALLLTVVIASAVTTTVAAGYFVIRDEKEKAKQQVEALQKSLEELQAKNETNQEAEKDTPISEATIQQTTTAKKSVEVAPIKTEEVKDEKYQNCVSACEAKYKACALSPEPEFGSPDAGKNLPCKFKNAECRQDCLKQKL